jgi:hypothetical protein
VAAAPSRWTVRCGTALPALASSAEDTPVVVQGCVDRMTQICLSRMCVTCMC